MRSPPDEDWWVKDIVELFERNSTIKGSVDNVTIYVMPIYYFDQRIYRAGFLVASLVVEKDVSGYTVKIFYQDPSEFHASNQRSVEKYAEKNYDGFIRLLRRAVSSKHPNAVKLAELIDCSEKTRLINLLYSIYGDEILNDDTIPGLHSLCSGNAEFFVNDKVAVIPGIDLVAFRDARRNKVFVYRYGRGDFHEVSPGRKIFYDALFIGSRDLLEPETVVEDKLGNRYTFSSSEVVVNGRKVVLVVVGRYKPSHLAGEIHSIINIFATSCDEDTEGQCTIYSFKNEQIIRNIVHEAKKQMPSGLEETLLEYILGIGEIHSKIKKQVAENLIKEHEWRILPA